MKCDNCIHYRICQDIECLAEDGHCNGYEDKRNFIKLPCKIGDTLYTNFSVQGDYFKKKNRPYSCKVIFIGINDGECFINVEYTNGRQWVYWFKDLGKTVFLTRKAAEQALKEHEKNE